MFNECPRLSSRQFISSSVSGCPFISVHRLNPHGHSIFLPERLRVSSCPHLGHALATGVDEDSDLTKVILKSSLHVNALSNVFFFPFNPFILSLPISEKLFQFFIGQGMLERFFPYLPTASLGNTGDETAVNIDRTL